jgi:hypothetical protein
VGAIKKQKYWVAERDGEGYLAMPRVVLESPGFRSLNPAARALLLDIGMQYKRGNNGRLVACGKYLRPLGWPSHDTINRCLNELMSAGLLFRTRRGQRPNKAAWYALTWFKLDTHPDMDAEAVDFRRGTYRLGGSAAPLIGSMVGLKTSARSPAVIRRPAPVQTSAVA